MSRRPPSDRCLTFAAELRVRGCPWEVIAQRLRRSTETVRRWPIHFAERWHDVFSRAMRRILTDAEGEAVLVLRDLLHSGDIKIRWHAAKALMRQRVDMGRLDLRTRGRSAAQPAPTPARPPEAGTAEPPAEPPAANPPAESQ